MATPYKPEASASRARDRLPLFLVFLVLALALGLLGIVLYQQTEQSSASSRRPSQAALTLAASFTHLYDISSTEAGTLVWSPDGTMLAVPGQYVRISGSSGPSVGPVTILDVATGRKIKEFSLPTQARELTWSPDGHMLAATTAGSDVYLLNTTSGTVERTITMPLPPNFPQTSPVKHLPWQHLYFRPQAVSWSTTSNHLIIVANISASNGRVDIDHYQEDEGVGYITVQEWDAGTGKLLRNTVLPPSARPWSLSPDGDALLLEETKYRAATQTHTTTWQIWNVPQAVATSGVSGPLLDDLSQTLMSPALWSPDSSRFAVINGRSLVIVDRATGGAQHILPEQLAPTYTSVPYAPRPAAIPTVPPPPINTAFSLAGLPNPVPSVAVPTDTARPTNTVTPTPTVDVNWVQGVVDAEWSPDGKTLAAYYDDVLRLWDPSTGQARWVTRWRPSDPYFSAFSHANRRELGWSSDGSLLALYVYREPIASLYLVDAQTGLEVKQIRDDIGRFEWSPKGMMLLVQAGNSTLTEVWGPGGK